MATIFPHQHQSQGKPIHFFKIITDHILHEGKLRGIHTKIRFSKIAQTPLFYAKPLIPLDGICFMDYFCIFRNMKMIPNKFVEKYEQGLSTNTIFLNTPNGDEWKINLEKRGGKIWFQKGWKEFAEHYSLSHGHFLVFRCQRISHFQVHIFGLSSLEIDYPSKRIEGKTACNNQRNKPLNDQSLEHERQGQKRKDNSSFEFLQPYQMRSCKCVKVDKEALHHTDTKCEEKSNATASQLSALDRASSFQLDNPFFLLVMRTSYVGPRGLPNLPSKFCWRHFDSHENKRLINLQDLNGKVWPVRHLVQRSDGSTRFRLSSGWTAFAKDNNLKVDDVCVFELTHKTNLTFLVHIFRETDSPSFQHIKNLVI